MTGLVLDLDYVQRAMPANRERSLKVTIETDVDDPFANRIELMERH